VVITIDYLILTVGGVKYKVHGSEKKNNVYPSVDVFIPAHNEGVVIMDTLYAMTRLEYKGELNIYLLNDNSVDETGEIAEEFSKVFKNINYVSVPPGEPKGKSRVLNYGLSISSGEYFVVYDGDNQPESHAVSLLMDAVMTEKGAVGAVGTVRTLNANSNNLTRMIAIEFQVFQLILQAGRWSRRKIGSLPGTNMMLKRSVIEELGGYDENALAEDAELTVRITAMGGLIAVESKSVTWEQEPETLKTLMRQRTRWLQGNFYLMLKFFREPSWWKGKCFNHMLHYFIVYFFFPIILIISNVLFVLGLLGIVNVDIQVPFLFIWFICYYVYTSQLIFAQWYDNTLSLKNVLISSIMYFTYAQLFIVLFFRGLIGYIRSKKNKKVEWDKTERVRIVK
ncbi:MAG: glycosyltransferase, partial [Clostridium sp.]